MVCLTHNLRTFSTNKNKDAKLIDSLITQSLNFAETVILWMTPTYSCSSGRICKIRIHDDGVVDISGSFMDDIKDIASTLRELTNFNNTIKTIHMTKTYKRPVTETITFECQHTAPPIESSGRRFDIYNLRKGSKDRWIPRDSTYFYEEF